ncbi:hypothetical protein [Blastococcus tunisiensis]|uniref:Uncharacterized protein n=1 Tax=Blastococcus tunisiensis TaxID=1798228 RepID=A0A1I2LI08_9ACTN|nr:hypothetical protein [Blastococcus sp. DSM 46838]SFF78683.1 hypothetical protein SAMN05216574_1274 [Blastococcus sp. DSM 46838]
MIITSKASLHAGDLVVAAEVTDVLHRRGQLDNPPVSLVVSDAVALGIAGLFRSDSESGRVMQRFYRSGNADSDELIEAARVEQVFASPEGHAALYCLIGWVRSRLQENQLV